MAGKLKFFDPNHPFLRPIGVRVAVVAVCAFWTVVEFTTGDPFWGAIFGGAGCYLGWALLLNFNPPKGDDE